jgi:uncharacterized DUF497 family protein
VGRRQASLERRQYSIDFADAAQVFADPRQYTLRSPRQDKERYIGKVHDTLIAVVITRRGDKFESFRPAPHARTNEHDMSGSKKKRQEDIVTLVTTLPNGTHTSSIGMVSSNAERVSRTGHA